MIMAQRIRRMVGGHWLMLFALICAGWIALFLMAAPNDMRTLAALYGSEFWQSLCVATPDVAGYLRLTAMWAIMAAAMMAPTALPAIATYDDLPVTSARQFSGFVAGYLFIWLGFAMVAAALQLGLTVAALVSPIGESLSPLFSALLLIGAGAYQFSAYKESCLAKCRNPITFFMERWSPGRWNPVHLGLQLGVICLGCCWALMLLAFVGGVSNLLWMGLAMVLMILEKLHEIGRYITRPLGFILIGSGVFLATISYL